MTIPGSTTLSPLPATEEEKTALPDGLLTDTDYRRLISDFKQAEGVVERLEPYVVKSDLSDGELKKIREDFGKEVTGGYDINEKLDTNAPVSLLKIEGASDATIEYIKQRNAKHFNVEFAIVTEKGTNDKILVTIGVDPETLNAVNAMEIKYEDEKRKEEKLAQAIVTQEAERVTAEVKGTAVTHVLDTNTLREALEAAKEAFGGGGKSDEPTKAALDSAKQAGEISPEVAEKLLANPSLKPTYTLEEARETAAGATRGVEISGGERVDGIPSHPSYTTGTPTRSEPALAR